jgi:hypothetical protein
MRNGNCFEPKGCKSDEKVLYGGCVKKCKSGEELKDGKCVKPDPSCRTKRQCQVYWVKIRKDLEKKHNVAKKNLRSAEMKLKNRRIQAMVPKASMKDLKNKLASLKVEIKNAVEARKKCSDALCPTGYTCNDTNGSCKERECKKGQE